MTFLFVSSFIPKVNLSSVPTTNFSTSIHHRPIQVSPTRPTPTRLVPQSKTEAKTPELDKVSSAIDSTPSISTLDFDPDAFQKKAKEVASDITNRPTFYIKGFGYVGIAFIGLTILNAVNTAVNAIPVLPNLLELVGLGYTGWFVWRFLLYEDSRAELKEKVDELIGKAKRSASGSESSRKSSKKGT